jgi:hypothetical protein
MVLLKEGFEGGLHVQSIASGHAAVARVVDRIHRPVAAHNQPRCERAVDGSQISRQPAHLRIAAAAKAADAAGERVVVGGGSVGVVGLGVDDDDVHEAVVERVPHVGRARRLGRSRRHAEARIVR